MTSSESPLRLAVIIGSTREGRFGPTVAHWFVGHAAQRADLAIDLIDPAQTRLPEHLSGTPETQGALEDMSSRLDAADAFVVVTPEYNHSYPAPLKTVIDWHYTQWRAKPVGFVSYGGMSGGLRAVEHLKQVFAEMHAVTVRDSVILPWATKQFDAQGQPVEPGPCAAAATKLLDQLAWFGHALRTARDQHPYAG